jgi:hypothetical protein
VIAQGIDSDITEVELVSEQVPLTKGASLHFEQA